MLGWAEQTALECLSTIICGRNISEILRISSVLMFVSWMFEYLPFERFCGLNVCGLSPEWSWAESTVSESIASIYICHWNYLSPECNFLEGWIKYLSVWMWTSAITKCNALQLLKLFVNEIIYHLKLFLTHNAQKHSLIWFLGAWYIYLVKQIKLYRST